MLQMLGRTILISFGRVHFLASLWVFSVRKFQDGSLFFVNPGQLRFCFTSILVFFSFSCFIEVFLFLSFEF